MEGQETVEPDRQRRRRRRGRQPRQRVRYAIIGPKSDDRSEIRRAPILRQSGDASRQSVSLRASSKSSSSSRSRRYRRPVFLRVHCSLVNEGVKSRVIQVSASTTSQDIITHLLPKFNLAHIDPETIRLCFKPSTHQKVPSCFRRGPRSLIVLENDQCPMLLRLHLRRGRLFLRSDKSLAGQVSQTEAHPQIVVDDDNDGDIRRSQSMTNLESGNASHVTIQPSASNEHLKWIPFDDQTRVGSSSSKINMLPSSDLNPDGSLTPVAVRSASNLSVPLRSSSKDEVSKSLENLLQSSDMPSLTDLTLRKATKRQSAPTTTLYPGTYVFASGPVGGTNVILTEKKSGTLRKLRKLQPICQAALIFSEGDQCLVLVPFRSTVVRINGHVIMRPTKLWSPESRIILGQNGPYLVRNPDRFQAPTPAFLTTPSSSPPERISKRSSMYRRSQSEETLETSQSQSDPMRQRPKSSMALKQFESPDTLSPYQHQHPVTLSSDPNLPISPNMQFRLTRSERQVLQKLLQPPEETKEAWNKWSLHGCITEQSDYQVKAMNLL